MDATRPDPPPASRLFHVVSSGAAIDDQRRERSLGALRLLDGERDPTFDSLVRLAADACQAAAAGITLMAADRSWYAAEHGPAPAASRYDSRCAEVVATEQPLAVVRAGAPGTGADHDPAVARRVEAAAGEAVYLGAPVRDPDGLVVGSAWVRWPAPRDVPDRLVRVVTGLAGQASDRLAQRRREFELEAVTDQRQRELRQEAAARRVLRELASGRGLLDVLGSLVQELETLLPGTRCSVMLLDGERLRVGAAPSLPPAFVATTNGIRVANGVGACGTAAATGRTTVSIDLRVDPRWDAFRDAADAAGLRSCWSVPIAAEMNRVVVGTFAVYRDEPSAPRHEELVTVDRFTELAALAIQHEERQVAFQRRARILDQVADAVLVAEPSSLAIRVANGAAAGIADKRVSELLGCRIDDLVADDDRDALLHAIELLRDGDRDRHTLELRMRRPRGRGIRAEMRLQLIEDELVAVARDLSDRDALDAALRDSEQLFRDLAERSLEGIYRLSLAPELRYEYVNEAFAALCEATPDELLADPSLPLERVHPGDRDALFAGRRGDGDVARRPRDVRFLQTDGSVRTVLLSELPIRDPDGAIVALQGIAVDVTERQRIQAALQTALEQERHTAERLRQVDALKDSFLQAVSHELRTPLTAVLGFAQTLRDHDHELPAERRRTLLARLTRNANRLSALLSDLLDLDRLAAGQGLAERRATDLIALVRKVAADVDIGDRELTVLPGSGGVVPVDAAKIERVVANLLENAAKHTPVGTRIVVDVRCGDDGCDIVVSDDGPGIDDDLRTEVFQTFTQGPASATDPQPGTGIGLALVARVAELHGGSAWVETSDTGGAAFHVRIPNDDG